MKDNAEDMELLVALWQATQELEEARLERHQLINECLDRGISPTRIGEMAGISKQAVYAYKNKRD